MDWDDLRVFLALARGGSVRAAAAALGVSGSTVARRIDRLESDCGSKLFDRLPTGFALTAIGESTLALAENVETDVFALERGVAGRDRALSGTLRVTMPSPVAIYLLLGSLRRFKELYPEIEVEFDVSSDILDLSRRAADVAIRFTGEPEPYLVGRRLPEFRDAVFATPAYVAAHSFDGPSPTAEWIGWQDHTRFPKWVRESEYPDCAAAWHLPDVLVQVEAARNGLGMAYLPCFIGDQEQDLCRVPPGTTHATRPAWVLTHPDLRTTERVRVFVRFIAAALAAEADLIGGRRPRNRSAAA